MNDEDLNILNSRLRSLEKQVETFAKVVSIAVQKTDKVERILSTNFEEIRTEVRALSEVLTEHTAIGNGLHGVME